MLSRGGYISHLQSSLFVEADTTNKPPYTEMYGGIMVDYLLSCFFLKHNRQNNADCDADCIRNTEAVKRIATAYLKLLFPNVQSTADITPREFKRYCFDRARRMRDTIKYQLGLLDSEYAGKDLPAFKIMGMDTQ